MGLYGAFCLYFVLISLKGLVGDWRRVLCIEFGVPAMMLAMMLGGAQFSGQVLRKPSVTVYGSVAAALLYVYLHPAPGTGRALEKGRLLVERRGHRPGTWGNRQGGTV